MWDLDDVERAAGLDPDSADYRLREALAQCDSELLEQLVQMRRDKGLTQQVVADRMHRDKAAVSNFERLSSDPHLSTIRRYAAAVGAIVSHTVADFDALSSADYPALLGRSMELTAYQDALDALMAEMTWSAPEPLNMQNVVPFRRAIRRREDPDELNFDELNFCNG